MNRRTTWIAAGASAVIIAAGAVGLAVANGGNDDQPLTGNALDRASSAALEHTGGGTVLETEVGDDGAAYGVEIRLDDGSVVEVQLDESFNVTGDEVDDDGSAEEDGSADDDGPSDD